MPQFNNIWSYLDFCASEGKRFHGTWNIFKPNQDAQASKVATQLTAFSWPMWTEFSLGTGLKIEWSTHLWTPLLSEQLCFVKPYKNVQLVEMKFTAHHCWSPGLPTLLTAAWSVSLPAVLLRACQTRFLGQFKSPIKEKRDPGKKKEVPRLLLGK